MRISIPLLVGIAMSLSKTAVAAPTPKPMMDTEAFESHMRQSLQEAAVRHQEDPKGQYHVSQRPGETVSTSNMHRLDLAQPMVPVAGLQRRQPTGTGQPDTVVGNTLTTLKGGVVGIDTTADPNAAPASGKNKGSGGSSSLLGNSGQVLDKEAVAINTPQAGVQQPHPQALATIHTQSDKIVEIQADSIGPLKMGNDTPPKQA